MRPGGGKAKGAQFEREVCAQLSRWLTKGKSESCMWRSAMSGGRATVRHRAGKSADGHGGDLTATDPRAHALLEAFTVECKHVADLNLRGAAIKGIGPLKDFWDQVTSDALRVDKEPMLIARQNMMPTLLFLRASRTQMYFGMVSQIECARFYKLDGYRVSMFLLDEFLEYLPYDKTRFRDRYGKTFAPRSASIEERPDQGVERLVSKRQP